MISEHSIKKAHEYLDSYTQAFPFSGTILLAHQGKPILKAAYGMADRSFQIPNTTEVRFPIASLSKAFSSMAILLLHQEKKLDIFAAVNKYLPSFAKTDGRIQLHQLMSNSSGLPDYRIPKGEKLSDIFAKPLDKEEWVKRFLSYEPLFEPGKQFSYSNPGYYLLSMVVEEVSGISFGEFLKQYIFFPLDMTNSGLDDPSSLIPLRASGYDLDNADYVPAPYTDARNFYPQGGLYSTVEDLLKWLDGLHTKALLIPELQQRMFTPYVKAGSQYDNHYGYGWHLLHMHDKRVYGHGGFHWGYRSHIEHHPEEALSLVMLSNNGFQDLMKISQPLLHILDDKEVSAPVKPSAVELDVSGYLGSYKAGDFEIRLWEEADRIWMKWGQSAAHEVYPIGKGHFQHSYIDEAYLIKEKENGKLYLAGCEKIN